MCLKNQSVRTRVREREGESERRWSDNDFYNLNMVEFRTGKRAGIAGSKYAPCCAHTRPSAWIVRTSLSISTMSGKGKRRQKRNQLKTQTTGVRRNDACSETMVISQDTKGRILFKYRDKYYAFHKCEHTFRPTDGRS